MNNCSNLLKGTCEKWYTRKGKQLEHPSSSAMMHTSSALTKLPALTKTELKLAKVADLEHSLCTSKNKRERRSVRKFHCPQSVLVENLEHCRCTVVKNEG